jgi:hypothetical protein
MLDLFVEFVALVAHGNPLETANPGNPHWLLMVRLEWELVPSEMYKSELKGNFAQRVFRQMNTRSSTENQKGPLLKIKRDH